MEIYQVIVISSKLNFIKKEVFKKIKSCVILEKVVNLQSLMKRSFWNEKNFPAKQQKEKKQTRLQRKNEQCWW